MPRIIKEEGALAADRLELVASGIAVPQSKSASTSGEAKRAAEDPVGAGRPEPRLAVRLLGLAAEEGATR